jgi:hypothetical protein
MGKRKVEKVEKLKRLLEIVELNETGYAGILPNGNIVDRRKFPTAIPIQENKMFRVAKPKPLEDENVTM